MSGDGTARETRGGPVQAAIRRKLSEALAPSRLDIVDDSGRHAGHVGARPEGETHFIVEVASAQFAGLSRVARQRLVHKALEDELQGRVHALALKTLTPEEDTAN
ncbi:MAG: BolA family transcriptional regulator [Rhodospirillales bacterium]|nr:BolA family transcriptional regulator [Rhodospirillales bacterium]